MYILNKIMRVGMTVMMVLTLIFGIIALYVHIIPENGILQMILGLFAGFFLVGPVAGIIYKVSGCIMKEYIKLFDDIFKIY